MSLKKLLVVSACAVAGISIVACSKPENGDSAKAVAVKEAAGHSHEGWWCDEHGVPEEECARCHPKLIADFKAKNDWCEKHNRPDSQCFICHPEKEAEYASLYEAKYGKQPPKPVGNADEPQKESTSKAT